MTVRAIVLSGGGVKGAFQVGALRAAFDQHPELVGDAWFGVSTGNLTAAVCAQSRTRAGQWALLGQVEDIYRRIGGNRDIYTGSRWWPVQLWKAWQGAALYNPAPLRALIRRHVQPERLLSGAAFRCGTVQLDDGEYYQWDGGDRGILDAILASASMPAFFPPVTIEGKSYVDGGVRNMTPLADAVSWLKAQADEDRELWVFLASPMQLQSVKGPWRRLLGTAKRSLAIALNEVYTDDLYKLRVKNHRPGYATIRMTAVAPTEDYGDALDFDPDTIERMLNDGGRAVVEVPRG